MMKQINIKKIKSITVFIVSVILVGALFLGLFSAFFVKFNHEDVGDDNLNNYPWPILPDSEHIFSDEDKVNQIKDKLISVPSSGTELNRVTFSDTASADPNVIRTTPGFRLGSGLKYGSFSSEDRYFKFSTNSENANHYYKDSFFAFYMLQESTAGNVQRLDPSQYDFITVDFDVWSESSYFDEMTFYFQGVSEDGTVIKNPAPWLTFAVDNNGNLCINGEIITLVSNHSMPLHITYIIDNRSLPIMRVFLNGEYLAEFSCTSFAEIEFFNVYFGKDFNSDRSVCFDNFQVIGFGNGDGSYRGSILNAFWEEEKFTINLKSIPDSVLY